MSTKLLYYDNNTALITSTNVNTTAVNSSYFDVSYVNAFTCDALVIWNAANFIYEDSADITIEVTGSPSGSAVVKSDTFSASDLTGENSNIIVWDSIGMTGTHSTYRVKITTTESFIHYDYKPLLDVYKTFSCDLASPHTQRLSHDSDYIEPLKQSTIRLEGLSVADKEEIMNQFYLRNTRSDIFDYGVLIKQDSDDVFINDYYYGSLQRIRIIENQRQKFTAFIDLVSR